MPRVGVRQALNSIFEFRAFADPPARPTWGAVFPRVGGSLALWPQRVAPVTAAVCARP